MSNDTCVDNWIEQQNWIANIVSNACFRIHLTNVSVPFRKRLIILWSLFTALTKFGFRCPYVVICKWHVCAHKFCKYATGWQG